MNIQVAGLSEGVILAYFKVLSQILFGGRKDYVRTVCILSKNEI
jgi:hypothetical protein